MTRWAITVAPLISLPGDVLGSTGEYASKIAVGKSLVVSGLCSAQA
jgi:hypothetical protein